MKPAEKPIFLSLVSDALAYYRQPVSEFTLSVWWQACQGCDLEQVRKALTAHAMDPDRGQFPPKVADVVRQLSGTTTDRALLAWGKVLEAFGRVGAYQDVVFDDPAIHAVVEDLGGWPKVARGELKDLGFLQKRFCDTYRAYVTVGTFAYPRRLPGDRDADSVYLKSGVPLPQPMLVGDYARCRAVYDGGGDTGKVRISQARDLLPPQLGMDPQ